MEELKLYILKFLEVYSKLILILISKIPKTLRFLNIDLVIVDLYPFEETVKSSNDHSEIIEKIDIGGISLIRAAAKNYENIVCISSSSQYESLIQTLKIDCSTDISYRHDLAVNAYYKSATYDYAIFSYLNNGSM